MKHFLVIIRSYKNPDILGPFSDEDRLRQAQKEGILSSCGTGFFKLDVEERGEMAMRSFTHEEIYNQAFWNKVEGR